MNRVFIAVAGMFASIAGHASAQDIRWTNPAGGGFNDAGNWEGGVVPTLHAPGYGSPARFDLTGAYAVTTGSGAFDGIRQVAGDVTFACGVMSVGVMEIGTTAGPRVGFHIVGGEFKRINPDGSPASLMVTIRNADVTTALDSAGFSAKILGSWGTVLIRDGSDVSLTSTFTRIPGPYILDVGTGCTLRMSGYQYGENLTSVGSVIATDVSVSFNGLSSQGTLTATNSTIYADAFSISGQANLTNCTLTAGGSNMVNLAGQIILSGPSMRVTSPVGCQGNVTLQNGAQFITSSCYVPANSRVTVGSGCTVHGVVLMSATATLAADAMASVGPLSMWAPAGKLQVTLDVLNRPATPTLITDSRAGTLVVVLQNSNALHIGDHIPLLRHNNATTGAYAAPQLPVLPGGRMLQLSYTPTLVYLDVVAGGTMPCWTADFNGDGDIGTDADIEAFFACLAGNCCATCGTADFNGDGDIGTDQDIEAFFRVLAGGAC